MPTRSYNSARRRARRRRAIRNRIIFGVFIAALIGLVIFLFSLVFKDCGGEGDEGTGTASTEAVTEEATGDGIITAANDFTAPVITGLPNQITVEVGSTVSYKAGVTVTDDTDPNPTLTVDNSAVDTSVAGSYDVLYTATDASGNTTMQRVTVVVTEPATTAETATDEEISQMKYLAGLYLKQIVSDDMSDYEKAERIWLWVNWNCDYTSTSDKSSWVRGAIQYFENHNGDCFNYFAAAKALLEQAGIQTIDVVKSDTTHSSHYWSLVNLGDGWYHFDATPRDGSGDFFFLVTDEQLDAYSQAHDGSHTFDHDAYTARATEIITDMDAQPSYYDFFDE